MNAKTYIFYIFVNEIINNTNMKERIISFFKQASSTIKNNPAEMTIIILCFILTSFIRENVITTNKLYPFVFPLFFILSYLLNKWFLKIPWRILYYISPLLIFPFFFIDVSNWIFSIEYLVALVIAGLMLLIRNWVSDNQSFTFQAVRYCTHLLQAALLSGCAYLLSIGIYYSIIYIFNIFPQSGYDVSSYLSMICFIIGMPWLFLTFNNRQEVAKLKDKKPILNILLNYIISPAILIYTVILYIYFTTILFSWSLPKGGIAYMVFAFTLIAVCTKALQPFLHKQIYSWYYRYFSLISTPAQLMFWIGVIYRIQQYGFTTSRTYLVICGIIMSGTLLLFLSKKTGKYLYITSISIILLTCFTYIPGITAKNIGIQSQSTRIKILSQKIGVLGTNNKLINIPKENNDSLLYQPEYKQLYEAFSYVKKEKGSDFVEQKYGIGSLPVPKEKEERYTSQYISLPQQDYKTDRIEINGYRYLYPIDSNETCSDISVSTSGKNLLIKNDNKVYLNISFNDLQTFLLQKAGLSENATKESLIQQENTLLNYETDSLYISFERIFFKLQPELVIDELRVGYILIK